MGYESLVENSGKAEQVTLWYGDKSRIMMMLEMPISLCVDRYLADIDATVKNATYRRMYVQTIMQRAPKRSL